MQMLQEQCFAKRIKVFILVAGVVPALIVFYGIRNVVLPKSYAVQTVFSGTSRVQADRDSNTLLEISQNSTAPWHMYENEVDLRLIILTFNRHRSLRKLLKSVSRLRSDGDYVSMEIWVDRHQVSNNVHLQTLRIARRFQRNHAQVHVHIHPKHVGLYGQWINTWRPRSADTDETALFLEDDMSLSPFAYRWLRAAKKFYGHRNDLAGYTLESENIQIVSRQSSFKKPPATDGAAYLYLVMDSWGFAPKPDVWIAFQDWFFRITANGREKFHPYVPGWIHTEWYKMFEQQNRTDSMWTMWFVYYCTQGRRLYTVYNNIQRIETGSPNCLSVNRLEPGLHFSGQDRPTVDNTHRLLQTWKKAFIQFKESPAILDFDGKRLDHNDQHLNI